EVDLKKPEMTIGVEVRKGRSFIWSEKFPGPGGLPVGTNAKLLGLISGGIDSPVAAIEILKRGSPCSLVHFHGTPFVDAAALEKVEDLVRRIQEYSPQELLLFVVPFGKIQEEVALKTHPKMRTLLYRRLMMRISEKIAFRRRALALVTGESLGQVA